MDLIQDYHPIHKFMIDEWLLDTMLSEIKRENNFVKIKL